MSVIMRKLLVTTDVSRKILLSSCAAGPFNSAVICRNNYSTDATGDFVLQSKVPDIDIPKVSINEFLFSKTNKWLNRTATECAVTGRKYTFDDIITKTKYLSRNLRKKLKLQKGDVIAILLPNCPEFAVTTMGALEAQLVITTLNPIYTPDEIAKQLQDSAAKVIVTLVDFFPLAKASSSICKQNIPILTIKTQQDQPIPRSALNFSEFLQEIDFPDLPPADPESLAFLPYSSGTTGLPKGVMLTHSNIISNLCQFDHANITRWTTDDHQDIMPAVLPQFHIYGLVSNVLHPIHKGVKVVALPKFTPELYISTLRKQKPQLLFVAPPIVLFLASHSTVTAEDLKSVRTVLSGAAPLGASDQQRFLEKAQRDINMLQGYGMTETSPAIALCTEASGKLPEAQGSVGTPVANTTIKIVDPNDPSRTSLGPNKSGEILVKGPQVMRGYHNRPEETKQTLVDGGWLRTGDVGYYNEQGFLFVTDRLKELIKVKGFQVPPAELEEVIRTYPDVADVGVIGIPHPIQGEVPRAYVVQKPGTKVDVQKLNEYVAGKVASYKQLRGGIEVVEAIPKNASGKIMRRQLKEMYDKESKK